MEIKPIKLIERVRSSELPQTRIDRNQVHPQSRQVDLPSGRWQFFKGQILINGKSLNSLMDDAVEKPAQHWSDLANDLNAFLNASIKRFPARRKKIRKGDKTNEFDDIDPTGELGQISALVEAYVGKIMRILKKKYDEKQDGISYTLDENDQLVLNGMNVTAFLKTAKEYPSGKAKLFLSGLKNRLGYILAGKTNSSSYEKIHGATMKIFEEIDLEIKRIIEKDRLLGNAKE